MSETTKDPSHFEVTELEKSAVEATRAPQRLTAKEAARYLDVKTSTLQNWRKRGGGPSWEKESGIRGQIWYPLDGLEAWKAIPKEAPPLEQLPGVIRIHLAALVKTLPVEQPEHIVNKGSRFLYGMISRRWKG